MRARSCLATSATGASQHHRLWHSTKQSSTLPGIQPTGWCANTAKRSSSSRDTCRSTCAPALVQEIQTGLKGSAPFAKKNSLQSTSTATCAKSTIGQVSLDTEEPSWNITLAIQRFLQNSGQWDVSIDTHMYRLNVIWHIDWHWKFQNFCLHQGHCPSLPLLYSLFSFSNEIKECRIKQK